MIKAIGKSALLLAAWLVSAYSIAQNQEQEVLTLLNEVRTNPKKFIETRALPYIRQQNLTTNKFAKSLLQDLKQTRAMAALVEAPALTTVARAHAIDMGTSGKAGHESSDGTPFNVRVRSQANAQGRIAENCAYGQTSALEFVMQLLIDDGIESLGHRKNILEPTYKWVGIAIEPHKTYRTNCVMDFAERL
ncbi:MAG: CAP domain-containing protein [Cyclobacteriaceae bacterium]|nr:CAP domain-containing protein [Cyclobacteriaceae bacterium]